uniref:PRS2 protein n=1 Tax=uncultured Thiotrichaceae bacterium TaxID=298394 RepID=A0A6S6SUG7_9GAMM|nr:MAG: Unknown protein [uncultured Thiotrichaceae bacterium]
MRNLNDWLSAYAESHQNPTNKLIHKICVPVIFFTVVALLWKLSFFLFVIVAAAATAFYYFMGKEVAILGGGMIALSLLLQLVVGFGWISLLVLFGLAWAGQFYGHQIEGQKPSFFDDLKFLLIGPLWVGEPLIKRIQASLT